MGIHAIRWLLITDRRQMKKSLVKQTEYRILRIGLASLSIFISLGVAGCLGSPTITITFENRTGDNLTMSINGVSEGTIISGGDLAVKAPLEVGEYRIKATNSKGEAVFSKTMTRDDMVEVNSRSYKVLIVPSSNSTSNRMFLLERPATLMKEAPPVFEKDIRSTYPDVMI